MRKRLALISVTSILYIFVGVQFYHWFKLYFPLFLCMVMHDNEFKTNKGNKIKIKDKIESQHIFPLTALDIIMILFKLQSLTYLEQGETRPKGKRCNIKLALQWLVNNKRQFNVLKATFKLVTTSLQHFF